MKLREESIGKVLFNINSSDFFLDLSPKGKKQNQDKTLLAYIQTNFP